MVYETIQFVCFLIGAYYLFDFLYRLFTPFVMVQNNLIKRYGGGWAVVTGGTDGIGLGYCEELARLGFNICIISRNQEKLRKVEKELRQKNQKIDTKIIQADFSKCFEENFFENILKELEGLNVSMLVNNVGTSNLGYYESFTLSQINKEAIMNLVPITMLTRYLLPSMLKKKKKSCIINLSSSASIIRMESGAGYCASKLYDDFLSRALGYEYSYKIDFLSVRPYLVTTPLTRNITGILYISKNQCVKGSLQAIGNTDVTYGDWRHCVQGEIGMTFPDWFRDKTTKGVWQWMNESFAKVDSNYSTVKSLNR